MEKEYKKLKKKVTAILQKAFGGSSIELEKSGAGKLAGFLVWDRFRGVEQIERQERLWKVLEKELAAEELLQISTILTLTSDEESVPKRNRHRSAV